MPRTEELKAQRYYCLDIAWHGDVCLARFRGSSLDDVWIDEMGDELCRLVQRDGCRKLVISFGEVDCLYSVLLGKLMTLRKVMLAHGGRLKLCDVPPLVHDVFRVCKVDGYFEFAPDQEAAMADW
jgi:anti-sigma B factor antagonist